MKRRTVLTAIGGVTVTSGCGGSLNRNCEPGPNDLRTLYEEMDRDRNRDVSVRGIVVRLSGGSLVVHDGTAPAEIAPPVFKEFNDDWFKPGDCVEADGTLSGKSSVKSGRLYISSTGDDVEMLGTAKGSPPEIPPKPDVEFDVEYNSVGGTATLTHEGGGAIEAAKLEVRRVDHQVSSYGWAELTDKRPEDSVTEGDSLTFSKPGSCQLVWQHGDYWHRPMSSGWRG